jgi:hypothetical protein
MDNKMDARTQPLKSIMATPEQALPMNTLTSSFEAGAAQRTNDGLGGALWLPPDVHGDDGPLEGAIAGSVVGEKQAEVAAVFERTEHNRPTEPDRYLSLIGVEVFHQPAKYLPLREAWLRDRGHDLSGFVAFHLSHAAACALKSWHTGGGRSCHRNQRESQ